MILRCLTLYTLGDTLFRRNVCYATREHYLLERILSIVWQLLDDGLHHCASLRVLRYFEPETRAPPFRGSSWNLGCSFPTFSIKTFNKFNAFKPFRVFGSC